MTAENTVTESHSSHTGKSGLFGPGGISFTVSRQTRGSAAADIIEQTHAGSLIGRHLVYEVVRRPQQEGSTRKKMVAKLVDYEDRYGVRSSINLLKVGLSLPFRAMQQFHPISLLIRFFMYAERMLKFGSRFQGRLNDDILAGALDYVKYNEVALAFELLCDHIWEHDVLISEEEYGEAMKLAVDMGLDYLEGSFKHLERLRNSASG